MSIFYVVTYNFQDDDLRNNFEIHLQGLGLQPTQNQSTYDGYPDLDRQPMIDNLHNFLSNQNLHIDDYCCLYLPCVAAHNIGKVEIKEQGQDFPLPSPIVPC